MVFFLCPLSLMGHTPFTGVFQSPPSGDPFSTYFLGILFLVLIFIYYQQKESLYFSVCVCVCVCVCALI